VADVSETQAGRDSRRLSTIAGFPSKQVVFLLLLASSFILAYFPVWKSLVAAWSASDDYSHGFLILPLCAYIAWQRRDALAEIVVKPTFLGLIIVGFSLLLYLIGRFGEISTLSSLSIVSTLAGVIVYLWGKNHLKELLFPLFLMFFMIPMPEQIYSSLTMPLQLFVSKISTDVAGLVGIPIFREGNVIFLPDRTLQVVQACSGLRSLMALLTLSVVFGYFALCSNVLRAILFVSAVPASIIVNVTRVLVLILCEYYFGIDLTSGILHTVFGVVIFALALAMIALIRGVLSTWDNQAISK
jgi:exosortase